MNGEAPQERANLDMDLAQIFLPAWARESETPERTPRAPERHESDDRGERPARRDADRNFRSKRGPGRGMDRNRSPQRDAPRTAPEPRPPSLDGWKVQFLPDSRGVDGLSRQIKITAKAYPLFDLALLILEKPERYIVEFERASESAPALFQLQSDGSVWLNEREAVSHAIKHQLDKFYRKESRQVEPPKGSFPFVALCGMSDILLGPPNYHDYQTKIRQVHAERFANIPFETYKSRIRIVRDEETIQKWREEQSTKDEFLPLATEDGVEPTRLGSPAEVERHFRENHASTAIVRVADRVKIRGECAFAASTPAVSQAARRHLDELKRFPLPLAHILGRELSARSLQIFKAHQNITYVSVARPRYLHREKTPIADGLRGILDYLEAHPTVARPEQWKALVALRPLRAEETEKEREAAVAKDLSWLLHEGHVVDYARRGLEAVRHQPPKGNR